MEFPRQDYWSGLLFPTPGALPDPEIELMFPQFPALSGRFFTWEALSVPQIIFNFIPSPLCSSHQIFL